MATEIERKFLVTDGSFLESPEAVRRVRRLTQGYPRAEGYSLRFQHVKHVGHRGKVLPEEGRITIKSPDPDTARIEHEYPIPASDALELIARYCGSSRVLKYRADVEHLGDVWEVDVYEDELSGLMVCELEFKADDIRLIHGKPPWVGPEVTSRPLYYNQNLAQHGWPPDFVSLVVDYERLKKDALRCRDLLQNWR